MSAFPHQVGGHPLTIFTTPTPSSDNKEENKEENGSTIIKSLTEKELNFYTTLGPKLNSDLIGVWTPNFYGTLKLEGKLGKDGKIEKSNEESLEGQQVSTKFIYWFVYLCLFERVLIFLSTVQMLVLENLAHRFIRANILDVKLGTQLYEDDAPLEKKTKMKKAARETTSLDTGIRLTGFQVSFSLLWQV